MRPLCRQHPQRALMGHEQVLPDACTMDGEGQHQRQDTRSSVSQMDPTRGKAVMSAAARPDVHSGPQAKRFCGPHPKSPVTAGQHDALIRLRRSQGCTCKDIAAELDAGISTVHNRCIALDLPWVQRGGPEQTLVTRGACDARIRAMLDARHTRKEICEALPCTIRTLDRRIHKIQKGTTA